MVRSNWRLPLASLTVSPLRAAAVTAALVLVSASCAGAVKTRCRWFAIVLLVSLAQPRTERYLATGRRRATVRARRAPACGVLSAAAGTPRASASPLPKLLPTAPPTTAGLSSRARSTTSAASAAATRAEQSSTRTAARRAWFCGAEGVQRRAVGQPRRPAAAQPASRAAPVRARARVASLACRRCPRRRLPPAARLPARVPPLIPGHCRTPPTCSLRSTRLPRGSC